MDKNIDTIPNSTMEALMNWHWPGNVRELENYIERSVILTEEGTVLHAPLAELRPDAAKSVGHGYHAGSGRTGAHHPGAAPVWGSGFRRPRSGAEVGSETNDAAVEDAKAADFAERLRSLSTSDLES